MNVEWLRIKVAPEYREKFIQKDEEIWTTFLSQSPGFLKKEVWISPDDKSEVIVAIYWTAQAQQQPIPQAKLDAVEQKFLAALGVPFQLLESRAYQVRKTSQVRC
jgi:uncharacterized protein (TIGR03792 family)